MIGRGLEDEALLRVERREVLEEQLVARLIGRFEVDRLDLDQREVALAFLRRPDLAGHGVAGLQIELADLRRRHVDVVGAGQVVVVGRAEEAEAVGQHFEDALGEDEAALLGLRLEDLEDQLLLAHAGGAGDVEVLGDLGELLDALVFQLGDVQAGATPLALIRASSALGPLTAAVLALVARLGTGRPVLPRLTLAAGTALLTWRPVAALAPLPAIAIAAFGALAALGARRRASRRCGLGCRGTFGRGGAAGLCLGGWFDIAVSSRRRGRRLRHGVGGCGRLRRRLFGGLAR